MKDTTASKKKKTWRWGFGTEMPKRTVNTTYFVSVDKLQIHLVFVCVCVSALNFQRQLPSAFSNSATKARCTAVFAN